MILPPFSDPSSGFVVGFEEDNDLVIWIFGRILSSFFAAHSSYLIIRYPASNIGCKFPGF